MKQYCYPAMSIDDPTILWMVLSRRTISVGRLWCTCFARYNVRITKRCYQDRGFCKNTQCLNTDPTVQDSTYRTSTWILVPSFYQNDVHHAQNRRLCPWLSRCSFSDENLVQKYRETLEFGLQICSNTDHLVELLKYMNTGVPTCISPADLEDLWGNEPALHQGR